MTVNNRVGGIRVMRRLLFPALILAFIAAGCAHGPHRPASVGPQEPTLQTPPVMLASNSGELPLKSPEALSESGGKSPGDKKNPDDLEKDYEDDKGNLSDVEEKEVEEVATIADPLEPFNRAMYHFNDKLYFWLVKPVAQGYKQVVPEPARISVKNFFSNLGFPIRFLSCLLQADFSGAATEFGRFTVNTIWGVGGLLDPAGSKDLNLAKRDADLGQTLGIYGVGQGFYIVWPVLGPSSARDSVEIVGEYFLYPVSYLNPWYAWMGVRAYEEVNDASLRIGDYEALKEAAIDPYLALRDAYVQYRFHKVKARGGKKGEPSPAGMRLER
jgi:phospholipid-binding lipoprotein MlaA